MEETHFMSVTTNFRNKVENLTINPWVEGKKECMVLFNLVIKSCLMFQQLKEVTIFTKRQVALLNLELFQDRLMLILELKFIKIKGSFTISKEKNKKT